MEPIFGGFDPNSLSTTQINQLTGFVTGMGTGMIIFSVALAIFEIVCLWKVFEKAGEPGWKCLIPIYNAYIFMKICWEGKYFWWSLLIMLIPGVITGIAAGTGSAAFSGIAGFLMVAAVIAVAVIEIMALVKLSKRFGKSGAFALGLIFLEPIFIAILAFGSDTYNRNLA